MAIFRLLSRQIALKIYRHWMTLVFLIVVIYLYLSLNKYSTPKGGYVNYDDDVIVSQRDASSNASSNGPGCIRPPLELMPAEFRTYFIPPTKFTCTDNKNLVAVRNGKVSVTEAALDKYSGNLKCHMIPIVRETDLMSKLDKTKQVDIHGTLKTETDFFKVMCHSHMLDKPAYSNVHSTIAQKPHLTGAKVPFPPGGLGLNVLMIGFDSVSRLTWLRSLPKTHDWFTTRMGGVVLEGYNIVGDGTPQALFPILVGKSETELPELRRGYIGARPLDDLTWIWREFSDAGYVTQWAEDGAEYGTFQYRMLGFKDAPVDHYMRPFYLYAEEQYGQHQPYCLGDTLRHNNMLNWGRQLFEVYRNRPKFSFLFHSELTHDKVNLLQLIDDDLVTFLDNMHLDGLLENTLLILMSDHGTRYNTIRNSVQGKFEERLPYFGVLLPEATRKQYPELYSNLRSNANKLTSPFDVHLMLKDILKTDVGAHSRTPSKDEIGISLFRDIPLSRKCQQAGIETHWCSCLRWVSLDLADDSLHAITWALMHQINEITRDFRDKCSELRITKVIRAEMFAPEASMLKFKGSADDDGRIPEFGDEILTSEILYQATIQTSPNGGIYEATIKHDLIEDHFTVDERQISRLNRYGADPVCVSVDYPHLRPYCYCTAHG